MSRKPPRLVPLLAHVASLPRLAAAPGLSDHAVNLAVRPPPHPTPHSTTPAPAAYYNDIFVGAIGGRVEPVEGSTGKRLYITVLAVLAPYRDRGVGACEGCHKGTGVGQGHGAVGCAASARSPAFQRAHSPRPVPRLPLPLPPTLPCAPSPAGSALLEQVLSSLPKHPEVKEVYLHVWAANDGAQRLYTRFGFSVDPGVVPNYYRGLDPTTAVVLRKEVNGGLAAAAPAPAAR